jgi:hypothetical protein
MTICSEIVQQAFRETNLIPIGTDPTTDEQAEGMKSLQGLAASIYGNEMGELLKLFPLGQNNISVPSGYPWGNGYPPQQWWVPLNVRVVCNLTAPVTDPPVYLNPAPQDGTRMGVVDASGNFATNNLALNGNGRTIEGLPEIILSADGTKTDWVYRADLGDWKKVAPLTLADEWPWPEDFDDMIVVMLAMRLNPRNSQPIAQESVLAMKRSKEQFRARYKQIVNTASDPGLLYPTVQTYPNNRRPYGYQPGTGDSGWAWPWSRWQ